MIRLMLLLTACAAVSPALALDRGRPPCPATEVAPGVKMRTSTCPMMFLPVETEPARDPFGRSPDDQALHGAPVTAPVRPALPVRQGDVTIRP